MPSHRMVDGESSSDIKYQRMKAPSTNEGYTELQFKRRPPKIPWRSISVAIALFVIGSCLLIMGALLFSGYISTQYEDRLWPVMILGILLFIPGAYHVRLALYAFKGYQGYSFEDIPDYDD